MHESSADGYPGDITHKHLYTCSIGEVGWQLRPGDGPLHSTHVHTETQTQLQLPSSTGDTGHTLSSETHHMHSAALHAPFPETTVTKSGDKGGGEKESGLEIAVNVEPHVEEVDDIGQNCSTSTLVNKDSLLQSLSSLSALTLTEISQVEGAQSIAQTLKEDKRAHLDKSQKELTTTIEATSQLTLRLDECTHGDEPLNKPPTTTEAKSQHFAGEKAADRDDHVDSIGDQGDGGLEREEGREKVEEGGLKPLQGLGRISVDGRTKLQEEPDTNLIIGDIVRSEMRKILEVYIIFLY